jgi:uncharacterized membrane protein YGL010W
MSQLGLLLEKYGESHQNPKNQAIHKICVPLIEWSLLGMMWALPHPEFFGSLNWAHLFVAFSLGYYVRFKNWKVFAASLLMLLPFWIFVSFHPPHLMAISIAVFVMAWIGQFYGHKIEGKKPSFFEDLAFLLIGPLWVVEAILRPRGKSLAD